MTLSPRSLFWSTVVAVALMPFGSAQPALIEERVPTEVAPPSETDATVYCTGMAPVPQPRCDAWFNAYSSLTISTGGTFTGELRCKLNGPLYSWREYRLEVVSGFLVAYGATGPGLYAGYIHMHCEAYGLYGAGGQYAGLGTISVRVDYA